MMKINHFSCPHPIPSKFLFSQTAAFARLLE